VSIPSWAEYKATYRNGQTLAGVSDTQGGFILNGVVDIANRYCGITFANSGGTQQTFTSEKYDGDGTPLLKLRSPPIVSITSVVITYDDGTTETVASGDYRVEAATGFLYRLASFAFPSDAASLSTPSNEWPAGFQNIAVTYTGAYTSSTYPAGLTLAIYEIVDEKLFHVGVRGTDAEPTNVDDIIKTHAHRLNPYRRVTV
jgi:hypothetical protein